MEHATLINNISDVSIYISSIFFNLRNKKGKKIISQFFFQFLIQELGDI